ncbi:MAG: DUF928 domain-containing protein [Oscillatoria sp. PMC 1068.18]|nr:DUF928 domain-containing protein [Oscillatoria sp. PMC 1076.18]MEC4989028.1 DUF928 domain-containing protein [Oscillatoria sp. PMC 1068.18]
MITLIQQFLHKHINLKLIIGFALSLTVAIAPAAQSGYVPGEQKPAPSDRRSDGGTTRGCSGEGMPLTVLASRNYVGRTSSSHPTFAWFVPSDSISKPMQFAIYERVPEGKTKEVHKIFLQSTPGIMSLSPFSENDLGLQPGKEYFWQIVINCDPDNPSGDLVGEASIEVVQIPAAVQSELNAATDSFEKVNIYAEAGLWYNTLAEALKLTEPGTLGDLGSSLLNDLAQWETQEISFELPPQELKTIEKWIENLKQIADSAR